MINTYILSWRPYRTILTEIGLVFLFYNFLEQQTGTKNGVQANGGNPK